MGADARLTLSKPYPNLYQDVPKTILKSPITHKNHTQIPYYSQKPYPNLLLLTKTTPKNIIIYEDHTQTLDIISGVRPFPFIIVYGLIDFI